jgi:peptidoglycan hydrolase-like protein with peptidoglycan-binding domain
MNAAVDSRLDVTGVYDRTTVRAVRAYQRMVTTAPNGVVADTTWARLTAGDLDASPSSSSRTLRREIVPPTA